MLIPKGWLKIARRFNAGSEPARQRVPQGRLKRMLIQPSLRDLFSPPPIPALKRRAIFTESLRDKKHCLIQMRQPCAFKKNIGLFNGRTNQSGSQINGNQRTTGESILQIAATRWRFFKMFDGSANIYRRGLAALKPNHQYPDVGWRYPGNSRSLT